MSFLDALSEKDRSCIFELRGEKEVLEVVSKIPSSVTFAKVALADQDMMDMPIGALMLPIFSKIYDLEQKVKELEAKLEGKND